MANSIHKNNLLFITKHLFVTNYEAAILHHNVKNFAYYKLCSDNETLKDARLKLNNLENALMIVQAFTDLFKQFFYQSIIYSYNYKSIDDKWIHDKD